MCTEIPTLLPPAPDMDGMSSKHHHHDDHHPGAQMAVAAAAMDDGLGAFRPSTSFNDLTSLLQSPAPAESVVKATTIVLVAPAVAAKSSSTTATTTATTTITTTTSKKRAAATNNAGAPAAKRRGGRTRSSGTTGGRRSTAKNAKANAVAAAAAATLAPPVAVVPKEVPSTIITTIAPACTTKTPVAAATTAVGQQRKNTRATARASPPNPLGAMVAKSSTPSALTVKLTAVKPCGPVPSAVVTPRVSPPINNRPSVSLTTAETNEAAATAAAVVAAAAAAVVAATNSAATAAAAAAAAEEEDFKTAAQAAVSNLILNGKSDDSVALEGTVASSSSSHIDTSTAHIQALTGSNWVTACGGGGGTSGGSVSGGAAEAAAACDDSKSQNRARRQNLTPDERARQNRDRNREHARNTRLRKKAYVEELKRTLTELVAQRDAAELDKKQSTQREMEQREVRFRVMEEFLKLRGRNEASVTRWAAILEEGFSLTLPMTDFRKMVQEDNHHNHNRDNNNNAVCLEQCLQGVGEVMADSVHVAAFLRSLRGDAEDHGTVTLAYHCERKDFFMDGCNTVLDWTATTVAARLLVRKCKMSTGRDLCCN